jgi:hypothetical protein
MRISSEPRFDAQTVGRLLTVNSSKRFQMEFKDAEGRLFVVTLPVRIAVELGCMICEVSQQAPYLFGGVRLTRPASNS